MKSRRMSVAFGAVLTTLTATATVVRGGQPTTVSAVTSRYVATGGRVAFDYPAGWVATTDPDGSAEVRPPDLGGPHRGTVTVQINNVPDPRIDAAALTRGVSRSVVRHGGKVGPVGTVKLAGVEARALTYDSLPVGDAPAFRTHVVIAVIGGNAYVVSVTAEPPDFDAFSRQSRVVFDSLVVGPKS